MALIRCPECGKEISNTAEKCPNCGCKTKHGSDVSTAKVYLVYWAIAAIMLIIGLILLFTSSLEMLDHSSYYWECGFWKEDRAFYMLIIGFSLIVGAGIDSWVLLKKTKELSSSDNASSNGNNNYGNSYPSSYGSGSDYVPAWKRVQEEDHISQE